MTKLVTIESSTVHDMAGRAKAGANDSATPRCVATEEAMSVRQTKPGARDRSGHARMIGLGCA